LAPQAINIAGNKAELVFTCPNERCHHFFIGYYVLQPDQEMHLISLKPANVKIDIIPEEIKKLSPQFVVIYQEALEARALDLNQIAGPGFRKAFEFLVKDYAKSKVGLEKHAEIESSFSGAVIKNFISDSRIEKVAKRALWLGNDETHYLRKWENHDIDDLINLIKLTLSWIEIERLSDQYVSEIPSE
jgi:hypothetical protein